MASRPGTTASIVAIVAEDDPLARTVTGTAPGPHPSVKPAPSLGESLGRYRLQQELGAGGMGVVHAALDPDLERRVAIKVLKAADAPEARQRLLREARAMARLTHPNVVVVHEVGSEGGRDYVAMELIDGGTLEDWVAQERRKPREIVAAFLAAGRGLAAAHAAGLVHRDFKPRNVLRAKTGRVVVTDFGLVVGIEAAGDGALDVTMRSSQANIETTATSSNLSGLTVTGALLGTPAYMAPEQWSGASVGPPADQFAFCVALWEALAGERPFKGATLDTLRGAIDRGPASLDDARLPRRLRKILRRGLDPDPAHRWPSMNALLAAITRAERGPGRVLAIAAAAAVTIGIGVWLLGRSPTGSPCAAPVLGPNVAWPMPPQDQLARQPLAIAQIDGDMRTWNAVRDRACRVDEAKRQARLACLDGALARVDALRQTLIAVGGTARLPVTDELVDPAVCEGPRPPRLARTLSSTYVEVIATSMRIAVAHEPFDESDASKLLDRTKNDPCAAAAARILAASSRKNSSNQSADLEEATREAQRCGDDRLLADVALQSARWAISEGSLDVRTSSTVRQAEVAAEAIPQHEVQAQLDIIHARVAAVGDDLDAAIARAEAAMQHHAARKQPLSVVEAGMEMLGYRQQRAHPEDLAIIGSTLEKWRTEVAALVPPGDRLLLELDIRLAWWQFVNGDVEGAHAKLEALHYVLPLDHPMQVLGRVLDDHGAPVAGATVAAGSDLYGDSIAAWVPDPGARIAITGADGRFSIPQAANDGIVIAQLGSRRSMPVPVAPDVTLTLGETSRLEGRVDLAGLPSTSVTVAVRDTGWPTASTYRGLRAPVKPDGTFSLDGVPRAKVLVQTAVSNGTATTIVGQQLVIAKPVETTRLAVQVSKRVVHVIVRSTVSQPISNAQVIVLPGKVPSSNLDVLMSLLDNANVKNVRPILGNNAPPAVLAKAKAGDLYATIPAVPEGQVSACAVGFPPLEQIDPTLAKQLDVVANRVRVQVPCVLLGPTDDVAIVAVPPWPRFD